MDVHTTGIFVTRARFNLWSVKINGVLYASGSIKSLQKHISNPKAKVGAHVEVTYVVLTKINNAKRMRAFGHIDLETGEFTEQGKNDPSLVGKFEALETSSVPEGVIRVVSDQMLKTWLAKFKRETKL